MRKITSFLLVWLILGPGLNWAQEKSATDLLQEAKVLIFDKQWVEAENRLATLIQKFPQSPVVTEALFYRARCLQELPNQEEKALAAYQEFLRRKRKIPSLEEEAEVSIIDLAFRLYQKGKKDYLSLLLNRLQSPNKVVKYYAALKLSYAGEKKYARRSIKVLKDIIAEEKDEELRDRAKVALLRVDPEIFQEFVRQETSARIKTLHLQVYEKGNLKVNLAIPWSLADLALRTVDEESKEILRKKGYDIDRILRELKEFKGEILEIKSEDSIVRIWVE